MSTDTESTTKVCRTCGRVPNVIRVGGRVVAYEHLEPADHPIDAVEADAADVIDRRCDFCLQPDPTRQLTVSTFQYDVPTTDDRKYGSLGAGLSCESCGDLIDQGQWSSLLQRAVAYWELRHQRKMEAEAVAGLRRVYRVLRRNAKGLTTPWIAPEDQA